MKPKIILILFSIWLLPALACNMPVRSNPDMSADAVQATLSVEQTLRAELFPDDSEQVIVVTPEPEGASNPFQSFQTPVPGVIPIEEGNGEEWFTYTIRSGDTLSALSARFGVGVEEIIADAAVSPEVLLPHGLRLLIPNRLEEPTYPGALLPDSEVIYSPSAKDFDTARFIQEAGGYLSTYVEEVDEEKLSGVEIFERAALETSISPRLLLAVLEYRSGWVFGRAEDIKTTNYPIGFYAPSHKGLFGELILTARQLTIGYYGWRSGKVLNTAFANGEQVRFHPELNAGSAAVQYLFSTLHSRGYWKQILYGEENFLTFYRGFAGDPWKRAAAVEPLFPMGLQPPELELPFLPGYPWNLTGGPHYAWGVGSPWGGVDFAPAGEQTGCYVSQKWATASAPGLVVRSGDGVVALDLDGDGYEQTGWVLIYLHVAEEDRVPVGAILNTDARIGHPSCEGGVSTGTHVHISRKYNGEWVAADATLPLVLSGWEVVPGEKRYQGKLVKGEQVIEARPDGSHTSLINR